MHPLLITTSNKHTQPDADSDIVAIMGSIPAASDVKPHAVCIPYPAQGHINPMLKVAKLLHHKGFHVTFVNTEFNHRRLLRSRGAGALDGLPDFRFAAIPDGLPPSDADATQDVPSLCKSTITTCLPHFTSLLRELNAPASGVPPVTCIVSDNIMSFTVDAASELGVPCALFWTASACGYLGYRNYPLLIQKGIAPFKEEQLTDEAYLDMPLGWLPGMSKHLRLKDMPTFIRTTDPDDFMVHYAIEQTERAALGTAFILNTFDDLERAALDAVQALLPNPVYNLGPLPFLARHVPDGAVNAIGGNLWKEEPACLQWLNGKKPGSVVYVNYGSVTIMTNEQLVEFAWGLANSGYEFLWIIRPDLVRGDTAVLPPEFEEATKERGSLASWCPQEEVLQHEAVGVFLTHSGWNSTVESVCGGVPVLSWPFFAEQQTNCRYACTEWGTGMEIGVDVRREVVEGMLREVMEGEKGKEMKAKAVEWKQSALRAAQAGGSSFVNFEKLVNDVLLSKKSGC